MPDRMSKEQLSRSLVVPKDDCAICMEKFSNVDDHLPVRLACGHWFGQTCIKKFLNTELPGQCPMCRKSVYDGLPVGVSEENRPIRAVGPIACSTLDQMWIEFCSMDPPESAMNFFQLYWNFIGILAHTINRPVGVSSLMSHELWHHISEILAIKLSTLDGPIPTTQPNIVRLKEAFRGELVPCPNDRVVSLTTLLLDGPKSFLVNMLPTSGARLWVQVEGATATRPLSLETNLHFLAMIMSTMITGSFSISDDPNEVMAIFPSIVQYKMLVDGRTNLESLANHAFNGGSDLVAIFRVLIGRQLMKPTPQMPIFSGDESEIDEVLRLFGAP